MSTTSRLELTAGDIDADDVDDDWERVSSSSGPPLTLPAMSQAASGIWILLMSEQSPAPASRLKTIRRRLTDGVSRVPAGNTPFS